MPQMAIWRRVACGISKDTRAKAYAPFRAPSPTHARSPSHTYTHTEICNTAFQLQQWFRERAFMLRYTYIAVVVSLSVTTASATSSWSAAIGMCSAVA